MWEAKSKTRKVKHGTLSSRCVKTIKSRYKTVYEIIKFCFFLYSVRMPSVANFKPVTVEYYTAKSDPKSNLALVMLYNSVYKVSTERHTANIILWLPHR